MNTSFDALLNFITGQETYWIVYDKVKLFCSSREEFNVYMSIARENFLNKKT